MGSTPETEQRPVRRRKQAAGHPLPPPRCRPRRHNRPASKEGDEDNDISLLGRKPSRRRRRPASRDIAAAAASAAPGAAAAWASPRLWVLLREAQEEMERGTDVLGDELNVLWRNVREGAAEDSGSSDDESSEGGGGGSIKTRRLPRREADTLLDGLEALQVEMEAEASSFQRRKTELMRKLETLPIGGGGGTGGASEAGPGEVRRHSRRREQDDGAAAGLEEEAESMRTAVIASHARLLGRVREV